MVESKDGHLRRKCTTMFLKGRGTTPFFKGINTMGQTQLLVTSHSDLQKFCFPAFQKTKGCLNQSSTTILLPHSAELKCTPMKTSECLQIRKKIKIPMLLKAQNQKRMIYRVNQQVEGKQGLTPRTTEVSLRVHYTYTSIVWCPPLIHPLPDPNSGFPFCNYAFQRKFWLHNPNKCLRVVLLSSIQTILKGKSLSCYIMRANSEPPSICVCGFFPPQQENLANKQIVYTS